MELTAGNLSRPRALAANSKSVQGVLFSARSESSSVEIVKTWLGFPYICEFFSDLPTPPTYIHAAQKIPTHSTRSILGGPGSGSGPGSGTGTGWPSPRARGAAATRACFFDRMEMYYQ
jgi:hypothetical protein